MVQERGDQGRMLPLEKYPMEKRVHIDGLVAKQENVHGSLGYGQLAVDDSSLVTMVQGGISERRLAISYIPRPPALGREEPSQQLVKSVHLIARSPSRARGLRRQYIESLVHAPIELNGSCKSRGTAISVTKPVLDSGTSDLPYLFPSRFTFPDDRDTRAGHGRGAWYALRNVGAASSLPVDVLQGPTSRLDPSCRKGNVERAGARRIPGKDAPEMPPKASVVPRCHRVCTSS